MPLRFSASSRSVVDTQKPGKSVFPKLSLRGDSAASSPVCEKPRLPCKLQDQGEQTEQDQLQDYIDFTNSAPSPPLSLPSPAPKAGALNIFPPHNRTDLFRPTTPPQLTAKQKAQLRLRTARLVLLQQLGHVHPLISRVKVNGNLKPTNYRLYESLFSDHNKSPQNWLVLPDQKVKEKPRWREELRWLEAMESELAKGRRLFKNPVEAFKTSAPEEETERKEETMKKCAQLGQALTRDDEDCAIEEDELDDGMMFSLELDS